MAAACLAARGWRKVEPVTQPPVITATEAYNHGVAAYQQKQYGQAMQWYRKAADQGYANAQLTIGAMHEKGQGVTRDKLGFPHFASPASYPAAQKMSSEAMNLKASSMGRMVRPNGPALVQRSFHSDQ